MIKYRGEKELSMNRNSIWHTTGNLPKPLQTIEGSKATSREIFEKAREETIPLFRKYWKSFLITIPVSNMLRQTTNTLIKRNICLEEMKCRQDNTF